MSSDLLISSVYIDLEHRIDLFREGDIRLFERRAIMEEESLRSKIDPEKISVIMMSDLRHIDEGPISTECDKSSILDESLELRYSLISEIGFYLRCSLSRIAIKK